MAKSTISIDDRRLKQAVKEVLREKLEQDRSWLQGVIEEVLEDIALAEAIRQGRTGKLVSRAAVFRVLQGKE
ncbi:MAG: hypothetical protein L0Y71_24780 [Gemmataceae bacterium]|nr:hypothetical protein [Gemmataceae bacterium]